MAFRRMRRRRPTVVWHQNQGLKDATLSVDQQTNVLLGGVGTGVLPYLGATSSAFSQRSPTSLYRLVEDFPGEALQTSGVREPSAILTGSGYRLRRIVGKIFLSSGTDSGATAPSILVGAGITVAQVNESDGAPLDSSTPWKYSPFKTPNERAPWIWQRSWILGNTNSSLAPFFLAFDYMNTEAGGSVMDGPHVDAKTNRLIGPRESLLLVLSMANPNNVAANDGAAVNMCFQYRVLTSPVRTSAGNRGNAAM